MLAITSFGQFWERDKVNFGVRGKGNHGKLLGFTGPRSKPNIVDFREQMGVYVLYDNNRNVVYIGQAGSGNNKLLSRLKSHTRNHMRARWDYFSWFGLRQHTLRNELSQKQTPDSRFSGTNSEALDEIEAVLIQVIEPKLNKQGSRWKDTTEFFQYIEEEADEEEDSDA
jgi:hypothetical protein